MLFTRLLRAAERLTHHPTDLRHLPRWLTMRGGSTMTQRVPLLPFDATAFLSGQICPGWRVWEWGGGGSTLWLADRGTRGSTIEHDPDWAADLRSHLTDRPWTVRHVGADDGLDGVAWDDETQTGRFGAYVHAIDAETDASLDLILVDGKDRSACLRAATPKLRPGALLVLDDAERPLYAEAMAELDQWPHCAFEGLRPFSPYFSRTTIWRKP